MQAGRQEARIGQKERGKVEDDSAARLAEKGTGRKKRERPMSERVLVPWPICERTRLRTHLHAMVPDRFRIICSRQIMADYGGETDRQRPFEVQIAALLVTAP